MRLTRIAVVLLLMLVCLPSRTFADPIIVDLGAGGSALTTDEFGPLDASGRTPNLDFAVVVLGGFKFSGPTGTVMTWAGAWMRSLGEVCGNAACPGSSFQFRIFADNNNAPDPSRELGFTPDFFQLADPDPWTLEKGQLTATSPGSLSLVDQAEYWIAVSTLGASPAQGAYAIAVAPGTGTTYFAPDPAVLGFFDFFPLDDANLAIYAEGLTPTAIPEPASLMLVGTGILVLHRTRRRLSRTRVRPAR